MAEGLRKHLSKDGIVSAVIDYMTAERKPNGQGGLGMESIGDFSGYFKEATYEGAVQGNNPGQRS